MKIKFLLAALLIAPLCATSLHAGTPAQDKDFVDKYKAAFEKGDKATLESFLYIKDANPDALEFYKMMQSEGAGRQNSQDRTRRSDAGRREESIGTHDWP